MAESDVRYVITITRQFGSLGRPIAKNSQSGSESTISTANWGTSR